LEVIALAASRTPGPHGTDESIVDINDGTLVRNLSPFPGPAGHEPHAGLNYPRIASRRVSQKGLPTLQQGSRDPLVRWAQLLLNQQGANPPLQPNSVFGPETHAAVLSFQNSRGLRANGVIGMDTWAKLVVILRAEQDSARPIVVRSPAVSLQPVTFPSAPSGAADVADWPLTVRFGKVLERVPRHLSPELAAQFRAMLTPTNIGIAVGSLAAWAVSHAFGAGEVIDVILFGVGVFFVGMAVVKAAEDIGDCLLLTLHAKDPSDLDKAAAALAQAVVILGITAFFALLAKVAARFARGSGAAGERGAAGAGTAAEEAAPKPPAVEAKAAAASAGTAEEAEAASGASGAQTGGEGGQPSPAKGSAKPKMGDPNAAQWRYQRYQAQKAAAGEEPLPYEEWKSRYYDTAESGGRPGRPGGTAHQADVRRTLMDNPDADPSVEVGGRWPDAVGQPGEPMQIRGQTITPEGNGRVIVESDHTVYDGTLPDSAARSQVRDMRAAEPGSTLVVTDCDNPSAPPLVYPPGTQPPPSGPLGADPPPRVPFNNGD